jgi:hypothetical protein
VVLCWQAEAIVADLQVQRVVCPELNATPAGLGMVGYVSKRFLRDTVHSHLDRRRQGPAWVGSLNYHLQRFHVVMSAVLGSLLTNGSNQAEFVESRRAQFVDQATNIGDDHPQGCAPLPHQCIGGAGVLWDQLTNRPGLQIEGGERGTQTIVQVAPQAAPFLLTSRDQVLS